MSTLYTRYVKESYTPSGELESLQFNIDENFNFSLDIIDGIAQEEPSRPALIWVNPEGEEHHFSFGDIKYWSDKTASFFQSIGVKAGDAVLVIVRRHYQFWFIAAALNKLGAIMVPATFMLKEHDLEYRLKAAHIKHIICTHTGDICQVLDNLEDQGKTFELENKIIVHGGTAGFGFDNLSDNEEALREPQKLEVCQLSAERLGWIDFNSGVRKASDSFSAYRPCASEGMLMYFTSGTSGNPKMVLHDASYALAHLVTAKHWHQVRPSGVHLSIADTGWGKAVWGKYYGQWLMGACVLAYDFDRFNPEEILNLVARFNITTLCCPPTMYRLMMQASLDNYDLSSLEHCTTAGEALNPDLFNFWLDHVGLKIYEGFGQTETPLTVGNLVNSTPRIGSMGKPSPLYTLEIQRPDGTRCNTGESGEICIKIDPKPVGIMMEYYLNPEKTAQAMHDGWYHTGDTAWVDEDGYFWYVGRNDDVIKSSGYRIGPFEIESVLLEHSAVREVAITGVPDELRGSIVKANIVLASGFEPSDELTQELQTWVKRKTAPYKFPRIIEYMNALPKTVNGKIRRAELRSKDSK